MTLSARVHKKRIRGISAAMAVLWMLGALVLWPPAASAAEQRLYGFHLPPTWVATSRIEYQASPPPGTDAGATWWLLLDRQVNVLPDGDEQYQRVAVKVLNSTGAERASQFNVVVEPTFQTLDIHALQIVREGTVIDERKSARITVLPQETELRERIYNGRYNINILLSDVRAGDVIEYSYTLHSQEKLFPGHFATRFQVGWDETIHREHIAVTWPVGRNLKYRLGGGTQTTQPEIHSNSRNLTLDWQDVKPTLSDDDTPSWYAQWPYAEVSDLQSWSEVTALVLPLFVQQARSGSGARVQAVADEIRARGGTPAVQLLHAVQYVQDQVRYASISIGRGTYMPTKPEEVLQRNFGDCKDKALLLAMILRELGVEAVPALVNSQRGKTLTDSLPSPYAFDHAIVRFPFGGEVMWVDPTVPKRHSLLSSSDPPDYETALLLTRPIAGLYDIHRPAIDSQRKVVNKLFDLSAGIEHPATLQVIHSYTRSLADNMRAVLANMGRAQFELDLRNSLGRYYSDATPLSPMVVDDRTESNLMEIQSRYRLEHPFVKNREGVLEFVIHTQELYPYAEPLDSSVRRSPLAIEFPLQVHEHVTVILPGDWPVEPNTVEVRNPAFLYRSQVNYIHGRLDIDYDYTALADHVDLPALSQYRADRKRFYDDLGYSLSKDPRAQLRGYAAAPVPLLVLVAALLGGGWVALRWGYRYDPQPMNADSDAPVGLGGWLTLVSLGVCVAPFFAVWFMSVWLEYVNAGVWDGLQAAAPAGYRGWIYPVVLAFITLTAWLLIGHFLLLVLFFKRRSSTPAVLVFIQWLGVVLGFSVVLFFNATGLYREPALTPQTLSEVFWTLVWTIYMYRSQRVRATFIRRLTQNGVEALVSRDQAATTTPTG
jgi:transglutaminase-like putative cysteine protease